MAILGGNLGLVQIQSSINSDGLTSERLECCWRYITVFLDNFCKILYTSF